MPRALETTDLPISIAMALWPWIDDVEAVRPGAAGTLRRTAERAVRDLRRLLVVTAPLETMLEDALRACVRVGDATGSTSEVAYARMEALLALNDLIAWLRRARPSAWACEAGVGW